MRNLLVLKPHGFILRHLAISCIALVILGNADAYAEGTNSKVATRFVDRAKLTPQQVEAVIRLGKRCGLKEPALVETFYYQPSIHTGIRIESVERVKGRVRDHDELEVSSSKPDSQALHEGEFWALPEPRTIRMVSFDINKKPFLLQIDKEITLATADAIMKAAVDGKISYPDDSGILPRRTLDVAKVGALSFDSKSKQYRFHQKSQTWVDFEFTDGQIKVIAIIEYRI